MPKVAGASSFGFVAQTWSKEEGQAAEPLEQGRAIDDAGSGFCIARVALSLCSLLGATMHTWSKEEGAAEKAEPLEEWDDADGYQPARRAFPEHP